MATATAASSRLIELEPKRKRVHVLLGVWFVSCVVCVRVLHVFVCSCVCQGGPMTITKKASHEPCWAAICFGKVFS